MAQYWTDFSEKNNGSLKGQGWTEQWMDYDYTVVEDAGSTGGKHVEMRDNAQFEAGTSLISWDDIDGDANRDNVEILMRFRQNTGGNNIFFALVRGANAYASRSGYMGTSQVDNDYVTIERFVSGSYGLVNNVTGITIDRDVWNWIRFRVNAGNLEAKVWADGSTEPASFQNITTDGNITAVGWVGFGVYGGGGSNVDIDVYSVGTDGDTATMDSPTPPPEPQTYSTNFSEYTSDQAPSDWTKRWQDMDFIVRDVEGALGGKVLRSEPNVNSVNNTIHGISWDTVDADPLRDDVDILMRFRYTLASGQQSAWTMGRGQGTLFSEKEAYGSSHYENLEYEIIGKWVGGASWNEIVVETGITQNIDTWYYKRFRIEGNTLKSKLWEVGSAEPTTWTIETTDNDITAVGWVGLGVDEDPAGLEVDYFAVSTGGDIAPKPIPQLTSPVNESVGISVTPLIEWEAFTGAVEYRLQVSTTNDFISPDIDIITTNTSYQVPQALSAVTLYFWRVRAIL